MVRASRRTVEDFLDPSFGRRLVSDAGDQGLLSIVGQGLQRLTAGRLRRYMENARPQRAICALCTKKALHSSPLNFRTLSFRCGR